MSGLGEAARVGDTPCGGQGTLADRSRGALPGQKTLPRRGQRGRDLTKLGDPVRGSWKRHTLRSGHCQWVRRALPDWRTVPVDQGWGKLSYWGTQPGVGSVTLPDRAKDTAQGLGKGGTL